jgi:hypothetical protein
MFTTMVAEPPVKPRMVPEPVSPAFQATQDTEVRSPPGSTLVTPDQVEAVGGPFTRLRQCRAQMSRVLANDLWSGGGKYRAHQSGGRVVAFSFGNVGLIVETGGVEMRKLVLPVLVAALAVAAGCSGGSSPASLGRTPKVPHSSTTLPHFSLTTPSTNPTMPTTSSPSTTMPPTSTIPSDSTTTLPSDSTPSSRVPKAALTSAKTHHHRHHHKKTKGTEVPPI